MESDSEKENYFSLYMKRKNNDSKKKTNFHSDRKIKNSCVSINKLKENNNKNGKLLLESSGKKNKNTFSFIKSYLNNYQDPENNKRGHDHGAKNITIDKQRIKNIRVNKSSTDINYHRKNKNNNNKEVVEDKNNSIDLTTNNTTYNNNQEKKIEKLKNRIFNLMNIIDNFEKDYINNTKPMQIKEQLNKINFKFISHNIDQTKNYKNTREQSSKTDRTNYNQNKKLKNNNKIDYIKLNENLQISNYNNYDNKNLTNRITTNKKQQRAASSKLCDKNKSIIMLIHNQTNNKYNNNSTFMKIISSNSSSKNSLNSINYNLGKNKGPFFNKQINSNSSSNKTFKNDKNKNPKESNKFNRRINYSNFINQKMKENNIIHRNQESYLKPNIISKSIYSYKNSNNSNGCPTQLIKSNNFYSPDILIANNKSISIDKKLIKLNDLNSYNNIINKNEIKSDKIRNRNRNEYKNELKYKFGSKDYNNNYFFSEKKDINVNNKEINN